MTEEEVMLVCFERLEFAVQTLKESNQSGDLPLAVVACSDLVQGATVTESNLASFIADAKLSPSTSTTKLLEIAKMSIAEIKEAKTRYNALLDTNNLDLNVRLADYLSGEK